MAGGGLIVAIDEAQFFPDLAVQVEKLLRMGVHVITAGLDAYFRCMPFGDLPKIAHLATIVDKKLAVCMHPGCQAEDAAFSYRLGDTGEDGEQTVPGGSELYEARCWRHHPVLVGYQPKDS